MSLNTLLQNVEIKIAKKGIAREKRAWKRQELPDGEL